MSGDILRLHAEPVEPPLRGDITVHTALRILDGPLAGGSFALNAETVLGRLNAGEIVGLGGESVSRRYAGIRVTPSGSTQTHSHFTTTHRSTETRSHVAADNRGASTDHPAHDQAACNDDDRGPRRGVCMPRT